jgi:hypothetical protein
MDLEYIDLLKKHVNDFVQAIRLFILDPRSQLFSYSLKYLIIILNHQNYLRLSQFRPVYPNGQLQAYVSRPYGLHVPPLRHGFGSQTLPKFK